MPDWTLLYTLQVTILHFRTTAKVPQVNNLYVCQLRIAPQVNNLHKCINPKDLKVHILRNKL